MSTVFATIAVSVTIVGLTATALAAIVRIVRGPTILDRIIASDVLLTTLVIAVGADMAIRGHTDGIPLMTGIAATAVLATIVVARYVKRRAELNAQRGSLPGERNGHV